jgi:hypothetical protein
MHAGMVEVAVANLLNYRVYTIVPNVSWGLGLRHECDILALDTDGRFTEIEIKVSASDLMADFKKRHGHDSKFISRLVYAMPENLVKSHGHHIPKQCGIISVKTIELNSVEYHKAEWYRHAKHDKLKQKPGDETVKKFMQLGCMRIWSLKTRIWSLKTALQNQKIK